MKRERLLAGLAAMGIDNGAGLTSLTIDSSTLTIVRLVRDRDGQVIRSIEDPDSLLTVTETVALEP